MLTAARNREPGNRDLQEAARGAGRAHRHGKLQGHGRHAGGSREIQGRRGHQDRTTPMRARPRRAAKRNYIRQTGTARGAEVEAVGLARARGYQAQVDALGSNATALVNVITSLSQGQRNSFPTFWSRADGAAARWMALRRQRCVSSRGTAATERRAAKHPRRKAGLRLCQTRRRESPRNPSARAARQPSDYSTGCKGSGMKRPASLGRPAPRVAR